MRPPTQANAPQIAIGPTGNGIVVWQEPEIDGVARIFARRLFGASLNYVMPVSATSFGGAPLNEDAEAPAVAFTRELGPMFKDKDATTGYDLFMMAENEEDLAEMKRLLYVATTRARDQLDVTQLKRKATAL